MTDRELEALLRDAQPPGWPPEHWETFPTRVVQRLQESGSRIGVRKPRHFLPAGFVWAGLAAAACVVLVFWQGPWHRGNVREPMPVTASVRLVSELTELFPNALRAVIIEGGHSRIVLSEQARAGGTEPVLIRLCRSSNCLTIVTFSGENIEVGPLKFEVLASGTDEVLLVGKDFVWSMMDSKAQLHGHNVEAVRLSEVL